MVTFRDTMDPHSVDVVRGEKLVAYLQWHPGREPRVVVLPTGVEFAEFTSAEARAMLEELSKRIAKWVRTETDKAMKPILSAFDPHDPRCTVNPKGALVDVEHVANCHCSPKARP